MNSQGTGEKNNDERTIRQETNETKSEREYKPSDDFSAKAKFVKEQRRTHNKTRNKRNKAKK